MMQTFTEVNTNAYWTVKGSQVQTTRPEMMTTKIHNQDSLNSQITMTTEFIVIMIVTDLMMITNVTITILHVMNIGMVNREWDWVQEHQNNQGNDTKQVYDKDSKQKAPHHTHHVDEDNRKPNT
jgi:hypothetical protein